MPLDPAALSSVYPTPRYWLVDLTYVKLGVATNLDALPGGAYVYCRPATRDEFRACPYRIHLHQPHALDPGEVAWLEANRSRTFRSERLRSGFYVTHHFGAPAYLFDYGNDVFVVGTTLEKLLWSYFAKYLLTVEAERRGALHLKAAAVEIGGRGVLLVGRGSGGKTVLAKQACARGAHFVCNTHCIVDGRGDAVGVHSPIRVRKDEIFSEAIERLNPDRHLEATEYVLSPKDLFDRAKPTTSISRILVVDFRGKERSEIVELSDRDTLNFMRTFSCPIPTYGIKDDVLSWLREDHQALFGFLANVEARLEALVARTRNFYVSADLAQPSNWSRLIGSAFQERRVA